MEHWWNDTDRGKLKYWEKSCHMDTTFTANLTYTGQESNPALCIDTQATNYLDNGTVCTY